MTGVTVGPPNTSLASTSPEPATPLTPSLRAVCWTDPSHSQEGDTLAQSMMDDLGRIAAPVVTAILEISAWVWSFVSQERLGIGVAVLIGLLGYKLVLLRRR